MKRVFLLWNLPPFMRAANANIAPTKHRDHVSREELVSLFSEDLVRMLQLRALNSARL